MPTRRSDIPLEGIKTHGLAGWKKGCGCFICRRGKADAQARFRASKDGFVPPPDTGITMPDGCGETETKVRIEIMDMGKLTHEADTIAHLAIKSAKLLDKIEVEGKYHLQSGTMKTLRDLMRELHGTLKTAGRGTEGEDDDLLGSLRTFGPQS